MPKGSKSQQKRPAKPTPDFPLFPHATGRWAKKVRGKFEFFGPWSDPFGALERYHAWRDNFDAGERRNRPRFADETGEWRATSRAAEARGTVAGEWTPAPPGSTPMPSARGGTSCRGWR